MKVFFQGSRAFCLWFSSMAMSAIIPYSRDDEGVACRVRYPSLLVFSVVDDVPPLLPPQTSAFAHTLRLTRRAAHGRADNTTNTSIRPCFCCCQAPIVYFNCVFRSPRLGHPVMVHGTQRLLPLLPLLLLLFVTVNETVSCLFTSCPSTRIWSQGRRQGVWTIEVTRSSGGRRRATDPFTKPTITGTTPFAIIRY